MKLLRENDLVDSNRAILLSIIIPAFNRQDALDNLLHALNKAIQQDSYEKLVEVIVIDDSSLAKLTIPAEMVCHSLILRNDTNLGAPKSREKGFQLSQGKFIHFHDSDDLITKTWLMELIKELAASPTLDLLLTGRIDQLKSKQIHRLHKFFHKHYIKPKKIAFRLIYRNCMGPLGGVTFSRKILKTVNFKPIASCQDWQMYIDAVENAEVLRSRPDIHFIFNKMGDDRYAWECPGIR